MSVLIKTYNALPAADIREILRYAQVKDADEAAHSLVRECVAEAESALRARVCYAEFPVKVDGKRCDFGFAAVESHALSRNLAPCSSAVVFAATLGIEPDRLISKYARITPSRAVVLDAVCAERIEALCGLFEREVTEGRESRPRFSAGYGDLPLEFQRDIFRALYPEKNIGLTLGESLIMSPSKSVTAIIGI